MERHSTRLTGVLIAIAAWIIAPPATACLVSNAAEDGGTPHPPTTMHEPAILSLLGMGLLGTGLATRRRKI